MSEEIESNQEEDATVSAEQPEPSELSEQNEQPELEGQSASEELSDTDEDSETAEQPSHDIEQLKRIVEGAILAAGEPLSILRIQSLFGEEEMPEKATLLQALNEIKDDSEGRGFKLIEVATGWRFQVVEDIAQWVNRLWEEKPQKYSRALLETLALIAYRQPITRGDIEEVRGVAVSSHIIKTLTERDWVKVVGHRDVPGRPALYATTRDFLDYFNLKSLDELPTLGELKDIESINQKLAFEEDGAKPDASNEEPLANNREPSANDEEPSASEESSADGEPSADGETSVNEAQEPSEDIEPSAETDIEPSVDQEPSAELEEEPQASVDLESETGDEVADELSADEERTAEAPLEDASLEEETLESDDDNVEPIAEADDAPLDD